MYKQSPGRNHRSKGIKVKNVLQICLLLAVCFWLIYQVKHSHDKKREFDEDDTKSSTKTESSNELLRLGRKDLPRIEELDTVNGTHKEEPEDETEEEEEGNKHEGEDQEEKNDEHREDEVDDHDQEKNDEHRENGEEEVDDHDEEKNDEHSEDGEDEVNDNDQEKKNDEPREDEVDEHDQEKSDVELDQQENIVDEDTEKGEDNEKETEERDAEVNEEHSLEDHDHDEDSSSSHEAREEHYKADDASSAVTHDTVVTTTENESGKLEQEAEHAVEAKSEVDVNNIMQHSADQNTTVALKVEDGKADGEDSPPNITNSGEKHDDPISSTATDTSVSNSTRAEGLTDNSESRTHSAEASTQLHDLFLQNGTQAANLEYNVTVGDATSGGSNLSISSSQQNGNSADTVDDNRIANLTSSKKDESNSIPVDSSIVSSDTEHSLAEKVVQGNATVEAVANVGLALKDNNAIEDEKADTTNEEIGTTDEGVDAASVENLAEVQDDPIDTSDSSTHLEEKHIRTDVETLPEIQTEGNMEDAAAE
ncbi:protein starmaker [Capsicum annuum]|uniref:protein starmaker n=1 Tax=Capsicum annuum TaxID=4072 RepID=UPI001FB1246E|nr:protein starmaker [Capsicum annuum]XP_016539395.2 protein starmaker [Capsicum annuum]